MTPFYLASWAFFGLAGYIIYQYSVGQRSQRKLPPGPKPLPLVGNIRDLPPAGVPEFQHWLKHKDLYGPISSITIFGTTFIFLHDKKAIQSILERSAVKTSGRPMMLFANKLCGYEDFVAFLGYDNKFRRRRKLLHRELGTKVSAAQFQAFQEVEVNHQLVRMLETPGDWVQHFRTTANATTLKVTYGYNIARNKPDPLVALIEKMLQEFTLAVTPFAWMVDFIPILQHLPEGLPGMGFKKTAQKWKATGRSVATVPYQFVHRQMGTTNHRQSIVSRLIQETKIKDPEKTGLHNQEEADIMWAASSLYGAASDSTVIALTAFTLAMTLYPEVQAKAQEEIDLVVGNGRLPHFGDREKLPYINAIMKESLRWWPLTPLGFPHLADEDMEYEGFLIPKGSYIFASIWWLLKDPDVYSDPELFDPSRYLSPRNEPDPALDAFGYGRRVCPGRILAEASLYLNIAQSLAVFNIKRAVDKDGNEVTVDPKPTPGVMCAPTEFQCQITPRSLKHVELIKRMGRETTHEESDDLNILIK